MNIWKAIGEKFGLDAAEADEKKKIKECPNRVWVIREKKKSVPSGSGRDAVPSPAEFSDLDWMSNHINNDHPLLQTCRVAMKAKMMLNGEEAESANNVERVW